MCDISVVDNMVHIGTDMACIDMCRLQQLRKSV